MSTTAIYNHCDYKDIKSFSIEDKNLQKVTATANKVAVDRICQFLVVTLYDFQLRSLSYEFPCHYQISNSSPFGYLSVRQTNPLFIFATFNKIHSSYNGQRSFVSDRDFLFNFSNEIMDKIISCRFMRMLLNGTKYDYDPHKLLDAYEEFHCLLTDITDSDILYREKLRKIKHLHRLIELRTEKVVFKTERGVNLQDFSSMALNALQCELDLLEKQIQFPKIFANNNVRNDKQSELYWNNSKHTKTALISLITALDAVEACVNSSGVRSPFNAIVKEFERMFNISIPNAYARRDELLGRGESRTRFLRELLRSLGGDVM